MNEILEQAKELEVQQTEQEQAEQNQPAQEQEQEKENKKSSPRKSPIMCSCVKFKFIGDEMTLQDLQGARYALKKGDEVIVPKGSLEIHLNARNTLFKRI